jgi:hypothetical protein
MSGIINTRNKILINNENGYFCNCKFSKQLCSARQIMNYYYVLEMIFNVYNSLLIRKREHL